MLRPVPLCCGACSGRTLCVLGHPLSVCGSLLREPPPAFFFFLLFGHTLGGVLLTLGGLLPKDSHLLSNKQAVHARMPTAPMFTTVLLPKDSQQPHNYASTECPICTERMWTWQLHLFGTSTPHGQWVGPHCPRCEFIMRQKAKESAGVNVADHAIIFKLCPFAVKIESNKALPSSSS